MALQYRNILSLSVSFSLIVFSRISHSRHDWACLKKEREGKKRERATAANDSCIVSQGANWLISGFKCHLFSLPPDIVLKEPQFNLCLYVHCTHTHIHTHIHFSPVAALSFLGLVSSEQTSGLTTMTAARLWERKREGGMEREGGRGSVSIGKGAAACALQSWALNCLPIWQ